VGDTSLSGVATRFKGSLGTLAGCFRDDGSQYCSKLSMKLKFDEYVRDQRFFGLKRLNFNSMILDSSSLRERLAYRLFREMGVAAPRAVHARLRINGELIGLFSLVEEGERATQEPAGGR
jgi:spore coat protein CotH